MFSWWAWKGFPHPSRTSVPGKLVLDSLKINRITPTPPPALPSTQKPFFCLTCLEQHDRRSRCDPRRDQTRHLMHSFSGSCLVPPLLQTHRIMAVEGSTKPSFHLLYRGLNLLLKESLLCPNNYLCFSAKGLLSTPHTCKVVILQFLLKCSATFQVILPHPAHKKPTTSSLFLKEPLLASGIYNK